MATLTAANSAMSLIVAGLFPAPQRIEGYSTDDAFSTDDINNAEVQMGVDGRLSGGYTPQPCVLTIVLQADSPSIDMFDDVLSAQNAQKELFIFDGVLLVQGTQRKYTFTRGFLTNMTPTDNAKKVLQPRTFKITFEKYSKAPI